jgi:hypothetical protein
VVSQVSGDDRHDRQMFAELGDETGKPLWKTVVRD